MDRGDAAERKVEKILESLKEEKKIENYGRTVPFSIEDKKGIDFFIYLETGKLKLQVKAGDFPKSKTERYRNKGIFVITNILSKTEKEIKEEILKILSSF